MLMRALGALPFQPMLLRTPRRPIASCFGGGGAFGIGFGMGVVSGLRDGGIPVDRGPMLGTSAGAWTAASVAADVTYEQLDALSCSFERTDDPACVIDMTRAVFGDRRDGRVSSMVIELPLGLRRVLCADCHDLADVVAASSSPPRFSKPHRIAGRRYIDAGILRSTSVDRAASAQVLVVVAPIAAGVAGPIGRAFENLTRTEIQQWRLKSGGGDVLFVRPSKEIASVVRGHGLDALIDPEVGRRVFEPSYELGIQAAERFRARHPRAAEELVATAAA